VLEALRASAAAGAGGGTVVVPGRVGAEVALTRSHLVSATRVEHGEPHERVGLHGGAVLIPRRVRRDQLPLFHEEVFAQELELGVGAARGGRGPGLAEQVLGGDWEGGVAIRAKEKKPRVGESVQGEVSSILGGGSWLVPGEGQPGARVTAAEDSVVGSVPVQGRRVQGGRKPSGSGVNLRWRTHYPQTGLAVFVCEAEVDRRQAGLHGKDVDRGAAKAVSGTPLDLVPKGCELSCHMNSGLKCVRAVAEDREKE